MPIEDVQYLYEKGAKESKVIFVDSSTRDMLAYPSPSEYVVEFTEPFTNVFGLEILDAAIPRTMYNVDTHSNSVVVAVGPRAQTDIVTNPTTVYVPALDYGSSELALELGNVLSINGITMNAAAIGTSVITFTSTFPFAFDMGRSSMSESLGFELVTNKNNLKIGRSNTSVSSPNYRMVSVSSNPGVGSSIFASVSTQVANTDNVITLAESYLPCPYDPLTMNNVTTFVPITASAWAAQCINVPAPTSGATFMLLTQLQVQMELVQTSYTSTPLLSWSLYNIKPTRTATPMFQGTLAFESTTMLATTSTFSANAYLRPGVDYWIVFEDTANITASTTSCYGIPYAPQPAPQLAPALVTTTVNSGTTWTDMFSASLCVTVTTTPITFVAAPNLSSIVDVFGTAYTAPTINYIPLTKTSWITEPINIDKTLFAYATVQDLQFQLIARGAVDITTTVLTWTICATSVNGSYPDAAPLYTGPLTLGAATTVDSATFYMATATLGTAPVIIDTKKTYWIVLQDTVTTTPNRCLCALYNGSTNLRLIDYSNYSIYCSSWDGLNWNELTLSTAQSPQHVCGSVTWALTAKAAAAAAVSLVTAPMYPVMPDRRIVGAHMTPLTSTHWIAQYISMPNTPTSLTLKVITVQLSQIGGTAATLRSSSLSWAIYLSSPDGSHPTTSLFTGALNIDPVTMVATSGDLSLNENALVVLRNDQTERYWLVVQDTDGNLDPANCVAATNIPGGTPDMSAAYLGISSDNGGNVWTKECNSFCVNITYTQKTFNMTPPGFLSLVGDRFIILRCPEIERNVFGSMAFGDNSPGIALFKMGCVGYSDSRFDFSTVAYKEFHPLGKLSRLSFRFERINGELYNFKSVNHHLLIVVKQYVARKVDLLTRSSLNPNYKPNFLEYTRYMEEHETSSVEEEELEVDSRSFRNVYLKKERALQAAYNEAKAEADDDVDESDDEMHHPTRYVGNVFHKEYRDTGPYQDSSSDEDI